MRCLRSPALAFVLLAAGGPAQAQDYDGYFSVLLAAMPDVAPGAGRQAVAELRTRLFAEAFFDPADRLHLRIGAYVDALVASRGVLADGTVASAIVRPADLFAEFRGRRFDLRAGMSRIVWGRLDEFQPTDVVNPIDLARFVYEGRSEARLPVGIVRGRVFLPRGTIVEGIVVPVFRPGRFDQLEEPSSPFNLAPFGIRERLEPAASLKNVQGGGRVTSTLGRVDWGVSAWRGFESFPVYTLQGVVPDPLGLAVPVFTETFPRYTMIGADFETVRGSWGLRGEFAWFDSVTPHSFEGGLGADRRAGDYRVAANVVVSRADDTDLTIVGWAERAFARDTRSIRLLGVYDPGDETAFVRGILALNLRDNVWLEGSAGWFTGSPTADGGQGSADVFGRLSMRDFLYARLKVHF